MGDLENEDEDEDDVDEAEDVDEGLEGGMTIQVSKDDDFNEGKTEDNTEDTNSQDRVCEDLDSQGQQEHKTENKTSPKQESIFTRFDF